MEIEYLSPVELVPYGKNAKRHPSEQVKKIGFQQPIVVDKNKSITHYISDIQKYQKDFIKSKRSADWWIDNMRAYGGRR